MPAHQTDDEKGIWSIPPHVCKLFFEKNRKHEWVEHRLPEIPKAQPVGAEILKTAAQMADENEEPGKIHKKPDVVNSFELMGLKLCCM